MSLGVLGWASHYPQYDNPLIGDLIDQVGHSEEMRRDSTSLRNRVDEEAAAMSVPADPQAVLDAIKDAQVVPGEADTVEELGDGS
jgi:hypothetical protein